MNKKRILSLVAATMLSVGVLAGCGNKGDFKDGTYAVEQKAADDKGYKATLTMEVKDGKIASVNYDEVDANGNGKESNEEYNKKMKELKGVNPSEAFPALEKSVVEKQSADVDTFTGASSSSKSFKAYAEKAIENAKEGKTEKTLMD